MAKIIERYPSENGFCFLADTKLSLKAKGLLAQVFLFRDEHFNTVAELNPEGNKAMVNILQELEKHGYLRRERSKEKGRFCDIVYHFSSERAFLKDGEE